MLNIEIVMEHIKDAVFQKTMPKSKLNPSMHGTCKHYALGCGIYSIFTGRILIELRSRVHSISSVF